MPILWRGRVTHILYVDRGHREQTPPDIAGEALILTQAITRSMEALIGKRKARTPQPA
jgi:hypothetical protein